MENVTFPIVQPWFPFAPSPPSVPPSPLLPAFYILLSHFRVQLLKQTTGFQVSQSVKVYFKSLWHILFLPSGITLPPCSGKKKNFFLQKPYLPHFGRINNILPLCKLYRDILNLHIFTSQLVSNYLMWPMTYTRVILILENGIYVSK